MKHARKWPLRIVVAFAGFFRPYTPSNAFTTKPGVRDHQEFSKGNTWLLRCVRTRSHISSARRFPCSNPDGQISKPFSPLLIFMKEIDDEATSKSPYSPSANGGVVSGATELWLDLRGTAISPLAALSHLSEDITPPFRGNFIAERVIVSEDGIGRALRDMRRYGAGRDDPDILYEREEDRTLRSVGDESSVHGGIISLDGEGSVDPIPALNIVSGGGWVVLDWDKVQDEQKREEAAKNLVEFMSFGAASENSLLLDDADGMQANSHDFVEKGASGGFSLCCKTKGDIIMAGSLAKLSQASRSLRATESGILFQHDSYNFGDVMSNAERAHGNSLKSAFLLPFDAMMWETALLLFSDCTEP